MRSIEKIIIHCAATPNGKDFRAYHIDRWHRQRGFDMIGYHYVIEINGNVATGRTEDLIGAHCAGYNSKSIGICLIGTDEFNELQTEALVALIQDIIIRYPDAIVHGHYEFSPKTCPNFDVKEFCKLYNF